MTAIPEIELIDGVRLPHIGFGTWPMNDSEASVAVAQALRTGYRLIDTAARYGNEKGVAEGIRASGVARKDIILTTKLRGAEHGFNSTLRAFDESAKRLGADYVDLYLIHWPLPAKDLYVDTWRAFIQLRDEGRVRALGVSNFQPAHIERLEKETGVLPSVNQIELHPDFSQPALRHWLADKGIAIQSWSPLGRGSLLQSPVLHALATKHQRSIAQIALRWHVQLGLVPIPKSQNPERIEENLNIFDFNLDDQDMAALAQLDGENRQGADPDTCDEE